MLLLFVHVPPVLRDNSVTISKVSPCVVKPAEILPPLPLNSEITALHNSLLPFKPAINLSNF